ncbi:MAG: hypothetical protein R3244_07975 [Thermoanaerobaculia bacterium]|nr:hypothetical protein [Thermoanaerobaculia bacterium]
MNTVENPTPSVASPPPPPAAEGRARDGKNPILAAVLSLFPGIGNIYNGLYLRGLAFFLICTACVILVAERPGPLFGLAIPFFWIFNIVDAYRQAALINAGYAQDLGIDEPPKIGKAGQGGLLVGAMLFLIGGFALLDRYFGPIDLDWLVDLWPLVLMAIGAWLIFDTVRDRKRRSLEDESFD